MIKSVILSVAILLLATDVLAQHEYTIEGHIKGLGNNTPVILFRSDGRVGHQIAIDSVRNDETFRFKQKIADGKLDNLSIFVNGDGFSRMSLNIYAEPDSKIKITGNDKLTYTWKVESNVKKQKEAGKYIDCARNEWIEMQNIYIRMEEKRKKKESIENVREEINNLTFKIDGKKIAFMKESKITEIWMDELSQLSMTCRMMEGYPYREDILKLYDRLDAEQKLSNEGQMIKINLFPPKVVKNGEPIVDGDLFDLNGAKHHLSDLKGKYILMDFWSCGCGPCIMSMPEMKEISETYKDRLHVVSLSTDKMKSWKEASARHNITWNNWSDDKQEAGLYARYGVMGIPHYVLISPEGNMVTSWMGYGKGNLKMRIKRWMLDEPSKVSQKASTDALVIMDVKQKDDATQLRLKIYATPHTWVIIASDTHLKLQDGTILKIKGAEGIKLDEKHSFGDECVEEYTLFFDKLPENCKQFDFIESKGWVIKDVML